MDRLLLQQKLEEILGSKNVYFQPPPSLVMQYPAIRYKLSRIDPIHADNVKYKTNKRYNIILIDINPDSEFVDKLYALPFCTFDRFYTANNLNHFSFNLY